MGSAPWAGPPDRPPPGRGVPVPRTHPRRRPQWSEWGSVEGLTSPEAGASRAGAGPCLPRPDGEQSGCVPDLPARVPAEAPRPGWVQPGLTPTSRDKVSWRATEGQDPQSQWLWNCREPLKASPGPWLVAPRPTESQKPLGSRAQDRRRPRARALGRWESGGGGRCRPEMGPAHELHPPLDH